MTSATAAGKKGRPPFPIGDEHVAAGRRATLELPIARLMSGTPVALPVIVLHGRNPGRTVALTAAVHGDELCGVEIIRRVLELLDPRSMNGTVVAVPVANVHGFNTGSRYLPDRRDLNRSFPGSSRGSLASRIAHLMMTGVITPADVAVDLHTGSDHRVNLPQVRADLDDAATLELAHVFGVPIAIHARTRDGSLRQAAKDVGTTTLLYEAGEADRFDEAAIVSGAQGVLRLLDHLGVAAVSPPAGVEVQVSRSTSWVRAKRSGIVHLDIALGDEVETGDRLAVIHDPFGKRLGSINARIGGMVIGHTQRPLVNRGDAIVHVAALEGSP